MGGNYSAKFFAVAQLPYKEKCQTNLGQRRLILRERDRSNDPDITGIDADNQKNLTLFAVTECQ